MPVSKEELEARRIPSQQRAAYVNQMVAQAFAPHQNTFQQRVQAVVSDNSSSKTKMYKLQQIMSDVRVFSAPYAACKEGCSNCCHMRVLISQTEANAIGEAIGVKAAQLPLGTPVKEEDDFGRNTPCTFLSAGKCSIYANRPVQCRNYINIDVDPLLCSYENWNLAKKRDPASVGIPMLGAAPIMSAYQMVSNGKAEVYNDIRKFFPGSI